MTGDPIADGTASLFGDAAPHRVEERHEAVRLFTPAPVQPDGALELGTGDDLVTCTDCGNTHAQHVIDCPVCDVPTGHVHGRFS